MYIAQKALVENPDDWTLIATGLQSAGIMKDDTNPCLPGTFSYNSAIIT